MEKYKDREQLSKYLGKRISFSGQTKQKGSIGLRSKILVKNISTPSAGEKIDHVWIDDLPRNKLKSGDKVSLSGRVIRYRSKNKDGKTVHKIGLAGIQNRMGQ
ncbi:MAG: hypothetical protein U9R12_01625 [Candidatus Caldatribacteriota bacterium]|nr:hypothetical protein [Candidatus Caldatribacteriota bacterium]